jgi:hypothetical protein
MASPGAKPGFSGWLIAKQSQHGNLHMGLLSGDANQIPGKSPLPKSSSLASG